jgi:uncharacterized protein YndB with AHSA1/START domain
MASKVGTENAISFQRTYAAPRERVFQAWTDPEALKQWFGPHDDYKIPTVEVDVRVGGKYRFVLVSPDGNNNTVVGTYKEIQPNEKLVFTFTWEEGGMDIGETLVTVEFRDKGNQTEVSLTHELLPTEEARQAHSEGWTGTLTRLESFL